MKIFLKSFYHYIIKGKIFIKFCIIFKLQFIMVIYLYFTTYKNENIKKNNLGDFRLSKNYQENNSLLTLLDYDNYTFAIIRDACYFCGLISFYIHYLGCISTFLSKGYIPIIDLSFPNIINGFNSSLYNKNPWELFFNQPLGFSLMNVINKAKKIKYFNCIVPYSIYEIHDIYKNKASLDFYHNLSIKYLSIKNEIIKEANNIRKKLFNNSNNILGVLARGTDYIALRPKSHPIPPTVDDIFLDIETLNKTYNYDFIFLTTEDDIIRDKFKNKFGSKLKIFNVNKNITYNYKAKEYLCYNKNINGNLNYNKVYLINIIILSKCTDIISAKTGGAIGTFILSNGFRNNKIYNLGYY